MSEFVTWTTPLMAAERHVKEAGELMEAKRTRDAMIEITKAQIALSQVTEWVLTRKA